MDLYEPNDMDHFIDVVTDYELFYSAREKEYAIKKEKEIAEKEKSIAEKEKEIVEINKDTKRKEKEIKEGKERIKKDLLSMSIQDVKNNPSLLEAIKIAFDLKVDGDTDQEKARIRALYRLIE